MRPTVLFDKSFLQSLKTDESVWLDHFFHSIICPLFYVETLADLDKPARKGRSPEKEVGIIADKFPEMRGIPHVHHLELARINLLGINIPMTYQAIVNNKLVKSNERSGVVYDKFSENYAFLRWSRGDFLETEQQYASVWRKDIASPNLDDDIAKKIREMGKSCKTPGDAKALAQSIVVDDRKPFELMKLTCSLLRIHRKYHKIICERWDIAGYRSLQDYAPYAAFVLTIRGSRLLVKQEMETQGWIAH